MNSIFVNLKRFDVPRALGGLCPSADPVAWIESVMAEAVEAGLGETDGLRLTFLLPEGLIPAATRQLAQLPAGRGAGIAIGCQGVHWEDIAPGKNFGAFTTSQPASAAANLGSTWAIIGHSEERKAKRQVMVAYDPAAASVPAAGERANRAIDQLIGAEVECALRAGLNVLLCVGETAEERGSEPFGAQQPRVEAVLSAQLHQGLQGAADDLRAGRIVIGYEPIWAIGPGKVPPGRDYIAFVAGHIKAVVRERFEASVPVVYGGGLKEENAGMLASIEAVDGGLIALTRFSGEIGFDVPGLKGIVAAYLASKGQGA